MQLIRKLMDIRIVFQKLTDEIRSNEAALGST